jgi:carboxypeptidase family protein
MGLQLPRGGLAEVHHSKRDLIFLRNTNGGMTMGCRFCLTPRRKFELASGMPVRLDVAKFAAKQFAGYGVQKKTMKCRKHDGHGMLVLELLLIFISSLSLGAADLAVNIVSAPDGAPLTNATVVASSGDKVLFTNGPALSPIRITIDPDIIPLEVAASAPGYSPIRATINSSDAATNLTLLLPKAQSIGGRVVEEGGARPVAGAHVFLNFPRKLTGPRIPVEDLPIVTDTNGHWQCDWLPADAAAVRIQVRHPDYEAVSGTAPTLDELHSGTAKTILRPLVGLTGVVLNPSGRPVAGATVVYGAGSMLFGVEKNLATHTDMEGRFRFAGIQKGDFAVGAYSDAFAPTAQVVNVQPGLAPIILRLGEPHTVSAQIVDNKGRPLSNVHVTWDEAGIFRYPGWEGVTDTEGRFQITNAILGEISVDIHKADFMGMAFIRLQPDVTNQTIILPPVLRFQGKVLEADSGKPVARFKIIPGIFRSVGAQSMAFSGSEYQAQNFSDGRFDFKLTSPPIGGINGPMQIALRITADGFQTETVGPFTNSEDNLVIHLHPPTSRSVRFLTPAGGPAAGTEVRMAGNLFSIQLQNGRFSPLNSSPQRRVTSSKADANGVMALEDDPDPKTSLAIHDFGFLLFATTNLAPGTVLRLTPWATVEGTLRLRGIPLTNQAVTLLVPYVPQGSGTNVVWYPHPLGNQQTTTDADGYFRFDRVPAGDISIARVEPVRPTPGMGYPIGGAIHTAVLETIRLEAGQHAKVELNEIGTDVAGRIVPPTDTPATYDWRYAGVNLSRPAPKIVAPTNLTVAAREQWLRDWFYSDKGKAYRPWISLLTGFDGRNGKLFPQGRSVPIQPDGAFLFRGLPPGQFNLSIFLNRPSTSGQFVQIMSWERTSLAFVVPENAGERFNLGDLGWTNSTPQVTAPEPSERVPFTVGISVDADDLTPHSIVPLRVRIRIARGHHIYATDESSQTYTPLSLKLTLPEGWKELGDWIGPESLLKDGHHVLTNDVIFRHPIIVPAKLTGAARFACEVRAQACNDQLCWPATTRTAEITIETKTETTNR